MDFRRRILSMAMALLTGCLFGNPGEVSAASPTAHFSGGAHLVNAHIATVPLPPDACTGTYSAPADVGVRCVCGPAGGCGVQTPIYAGTYNGSGTNYNYMVTPGHCTNSTTCDGTADVLGDQRPWAENGSTAATTKIFAVPSTVYGGGINGQSYTISQTAGANAAAFCENMTFGGYSDWYLPANGQAHFIGELYSVIYLNRVKLAATGGGFTTSYYWSSTEGAGNTLARAQFFLNGATNSNGKVIPANVRCVRRY